jgi:hypothetical protein
MTASDVVRMLKARKSGPEMTAAYNMAGGRSACNMAGSIPIIGTKDNEAQPDGLNRSTN